MKKFFSVLVILCCANASAQIKYVPYLIEGKYGIFNTETNELWQPVFDKVELEHEPYLFTGYKSQSDGNFVSSLIKRNEYVIKDKPYFDYLVYKNAIVAVDTSELGIPDYYSLFYQTKLHLYSIHGELLLDHFFSEIIVFPDYSTFKNTPEILIYARELNNLALSSVFLYDPIQEEVTAVLLDKVENLKFEDRDERVWTQLGIDIEYIEGNDMVRVKLDVVDNKIQIISKRTEATVAKSNSAYNRTNFVEVPEPLTQSQGVGKSEFESINFVYLVNSHRNVLDKNYLKLRPDLSNSIHKAFEKNGKIGLIDTKNDQILLDAKFDQIYRMLGCYILKLDGVFGLYFPHKQLFIEPTFNYFPYLVYEEFQLEENNLFGFFNATTMEFECFGTIEGELYKK